MNQNLRLVTLTLHVDGICTNLNLVLEHNNLRCLTNIQLTWSSIKQSEYSEILYFVYDLRIHILLKNFNWTSCKKVYNLLSLIFEYHKVE